MKLKDLPVEPMPTPPNRRVYAFFWGPFDAVFNLLGLVLSCSKLGMTFALVVGLVFTIFLWLLGGLTGKTVLGLFIIAVLAGLGLTALLALLNLLARMLRL